MSIIFCLPRVVMSRLSFSSFPYGLNFQFLQKYQQNWPAPLSPIPQQGLVALPCWQFKKTWRSSNSPSRDLLSSHALLGQAGEISFCLELSALKHLIPDFLGQAHPTHKPIQFCKCLIGCASCSQILSAQGREKEAWDMVVSSCFLCSLKKHSIAGTTRPSSGKDTGKKLS